jgi:L-rhamnose isomerase/sugar isomerase
VDRDALAQVQREGDVLAGHRILLDAFQTDVRPHCAQARVALGAAEDPIAELRASGYAGRRAAERGEGESVAGGWGR